MTETAQAARKLLSTSPVMQDHATRALALAEANVCAILAVADAIDGLAHVIRELIDVQGPDDTTEG